MFAAGYTVFTRYENITVSIYDYGFGITIIVKFEHHMPAHTHIETDTIDAHRGGHL